MTSINPAINELTGSNLLDGSDEWTTIDAEAFDPLQIIKEFESLSPRQKNIATNMLNQKQRISLISICLKKEAPLPSPHELEAISCALKIAKKTTYAITCADDRISSLYYITKKTRQIFSGACSFLAKAFTGISAEEALIQINTQEKVHSTCLPQAKLKTIIQKAKTTTTPLNIVLTNAGLSTTLSHLDLSKFSFEGVNLSGITFKQCSFNECSFTNIDVDNVIFKDTFFNNCYFTNSKITHCQFHNSELTGTSFINAHIKSTTITSSDVLGCSFEEANLIDSKFENTALKGSHFLQAEVKDTSILSSNLLDTIFFGQDTNFKIDDSSRETQKVESKVSAMIFTPEARGITTPKAYLKLEQSADTVPIRISFAVPGVDVEELNAQVSKALAAIAAEGHEDISISEALLKRLSQDPTTCASIRKIAEKARLVTQHTNVVLLPGGEDIPPALYGDEQDPATNWGDNYTRSLLELFLIQKSQSRGLPLVGICRGFQMIGVFFGSKLDQDVTGQKGLQKFTLTPQLTSKALQSSDDDTFQVIDAHSSLYSNAFKGSLTSAVFHHQAIRELPEESRLDVSVVHDGFIKAIEPKAPSSAPIIGLQFHPEFFNAPTAHSNQRELIDRGLTTSMSTENEAFWKLIGDVARAHKAKKKALFGLNA